MAKSNIAKFRKTIEVLEHILTLKSVSFVDSVFGETFYVGAYDNTAQENIIVTGGSKALIAQLRSIDDPIELVVMIVERGKSYELKEHNV